MAEQNKVENVIEKTAGKLNIVLPTGHVSFALRMIVFLTALGGINFIAGTFTDVEIDIWMYVFRILIGLTALETAYGILERKRWSIWLYGLLAGMMLIVNPVIAILPGAITIYLFLQRDKFELSFLDQTYIHISSKIVSAFSKYSRQ